MVFMGYVNSADPVFRPVVPKDGGEEMKRQEEPEPPPTCLCLLAMMTPTPKLYPNSNINDREQFLLLTQLLYRTIEDVDPRKNTGF